MNLRKSVLHILVISSVLFAQLAFAAEEEIPIGKEIRIGNTKPVWVSLSGFSGEALEALQFDLYVQGYNFTNAEGAAYLLTGSNNGNLQARATDKTGRRDIVPTKLYTGSKLRQQVHWFADDFVNALPGQKGI